MRLSVVLASLGPALAAAVAIDAQVRPSPAPSPVNFVRQLSSMAQLDSLGSADQAYIRLGKSTKFLIDTGVRPATRTITPSVYFFNSSSKNPYVRYHYDFARNLIPSPVPRYTGSVAEFNSKTYFVPDNKYFVAGNIATYLYNATKILALQLYPQDIASPAAIFRAVRFIKQRIAFNNVPVYFVSTGDQQSIEPIRSNLTAINVGTISLETILADLPFFPVKNGTTYGFLRVDPNPIQQQRLTPTDIPVFTELPLELSVVAGVITTQFQDANSHVALKSRERGTPNMYLRNATNNPIVSALADKPVKLVITADSWSLTLSTVDEVTSFHKTYIANWSNLTYVPTDNIVTFKNMCSTTRPQDCLAQSTKFGSKASNLAFLRNARVLGTVSDAGSLSANFGYNLSPDGFGIPFTFYERFLNLNPTIRAAIESLESDIYNFDTSVEEVDARADVIRNMTMAAKVPFDDLSAIYASIYNVFGNITLPPTETKGMKLKFRSSANAEDIPNFSGAGLYNSFAGRIKIATNETAQNVTTLCKFKFDPEEGDLEVSPKTIECAVKGVWASLFTSRGIAERRFAKIRSGAKMAIAVVLGYDSFSPVTANNVVITRITEAPRGALSGYTIATQVNNTLVTNPTLGTIAESTWAVIGTTTEPISFATLRYAVPTPGVPRLTTRVLSDARMLQLIRIAQTAEIAYCRAINGDGVGRPMTLTSCTNVATDASKKFAMDMEFKHFENGQILCKQIREFRG